MSEETSGTSIPWPGRSYADSIIRRAPAAFFLLNAVGTYLYLLGGTALERARYAGEAVIAPPPGSDPFAPPPPGSDPADRPRPDLLGFLGTPEKARGLGGAAVAVGVSLSVFAFWRYWKDGSAGVRNPQLPLSIRAKPHIFFGVQAVCTGLAIYFRAFYLEALRDHRQGHAIWGPVAVGSVASGVFAAIQAQAFSSSELLRGPVLLHHRNDFARACRFLYGIGLRVLGHIVGIEETSVAARQGLRIATFASLSMAYAMPLTLVRMNPSHQRAQIGAYQQQGDERASRALWGKLPGHWVPPLVLLMYMVGQCLGGLFAVPISQVAVDDELGMPPPPHDRNNAPFYAAVVGVAVGIAVEIFASGIFWWDARKHAKSVEERVRQLPNAPRTHAKLLADLFFAGAVVSSLCLFTARILTETAKRPLPQAQEGVAVALGAASIALQQLCVPELYAFSQVMRGRPNFPFMQDTLLAARYFGSVLADVWVVASNVPVFQAFGRDALLVGSNFGTLIGLGIPTGVAYHEDARAFGEGIEQYMLEQVEGGGTVAPTQRRESAMSWHQNQVA